MEVFRDQLALRLAKCIGGLHFQVAERTLLLWNSERFGSMMLEHAGNRAAVLPILFPALFSNQVRWAEQSSSCRQAGPSTPAPVPPPSRRRATGTSPSGR